MDQTLEASTLHAFRDAVSRCVRSVPPGSVVSYGDVATWIGRPGAARQVGAALRSLAAEDPTFPWQRVVNAKGGISTYKVGLGEIQVALLRSEGVNVDDDTIDMAQYRFKPADDAGAVDGSGYHAAMTSSASDSPTLELARDLVRAASPSRRETPAALVLRDAMQAHGFDEAWIDEAGNAVGVIRRGAGPTIMLNGHIDTVPVGNEDLWPHPPLAGVVADGRLWGRGASDMKSSLACMVVAAGEVARQGFAGTIILAGVVQEEIGGLGARWLSEHHQPDLVILGEPSKMQFKLGHRGRIEVDVHLPGRIAHAAKADLGENALYRAARYLAKLEALELPGDGLLGASTATPTRLRSLPEDGANVVPGEAIITIDYRNVPSDPPEEVLARLARLDPDATLRITDEHAVSENGSVDRRFPRINPAYLAPGENHWTNAVRDALREILPRHGIPFEEGTWWFATDAPHLAREGAIVLGLGPGEEELAHTTQESVRLDMLAVGTTTYRDLLLALLPEPS